MISCSEYDYIELVCMYRYPIKLTMKSGVVIECAAVDTQRNEELEECIKVDVDGTERLVVLNAISKLEVTVENPHLQELCFNNIAGPEEWE